MTDIPSLKAIYLTLIASNLDSCKIPFDCDLKLFHRGHLLEYSGWGMLSGSVPEGGGCGLERDYSIEFDGGLSYHFTADASGWNHHDNKLELDFFRMID